MSKRRDEQRTNFVVGMFVIAFGTLLLASLFLIAISEGVLTEKTTIRSHFRTVSGLQKASKVQLAGKEIGVVEDVSFIAPTYECNPITEDLGRFGSTRTDDCEPSLFCTPAGNSGLCAAIRGSTRAAPTTARAASSRSA
jgi:hypothetical protein